MTEKDLPQAVFRLKQKLDDAPASRVFVPLADVYLRLNQPEDAIDVLTEGLKHHPTYVAARMVLGTTYQNAGRITESKREFEEIVRLHPQNILAYKKLAALYRQTGQLGEAIEVCNRGLRTDPHDKDMKALLALVQEEISFSEEPADIAPFIAIPSMTPPVSTAVKWPPLPSSESDTEILENLSYALPAPIIEESFVEETFIEEPIHYEEAEAPIETVSSAPEIEETICLEPAAWPSEAEPEVSQVPFPKEEKATTTSPLVFTPQTEYNRPSLHLIRLREWLVSIEHKGVKR